MNTDVEQFNLPGVGSFGYSALPPVALDDSEYTLVTMVVDVTGSVTPFKTELLEMVRSVVGACKKNPRSENLLIRLVTFNSSVFEVHGFLPLSSINADDYKELHPSGSTSLYDAVYSSVEATVSYGKTLTDQEFDVNAAVYVITDGADNASTTSLSNVKAAVSKSLVTESLESIQLVLIAINDADPYVKTRLQEFHAESGMNHPPISVGDATPSKLAQLANFVSKSISSQSQALGTGGPSQSLSF